MYWHSHLHWYTYRKGKSTACVYQFSEMVPVYLDKLCDDALGNTTASLCSQVVSHQVSHCSDSTGGNRDLEEEGIGV